MSPESHFGGLANRYGAAGEQSDWRVVIRQYERDNLKGAYAKAKSLGAGTGGYGIVTFRLIEAEYYTRRDGKKHQVNDWLTLEFIEDRVGPILDEVVELTLKSCDAVAHLLRFEHSVPVLITFLSPEADVPWVPGRHGFFIDKKDYSKICIPDYALNNKGVLEEVIRHEYAHLVNMARSLAQIVTWLDEGLAMVVSGRGDDDAWRRLANGDYEWHEPRDLDKAFSVDRSEEGNRNYIWAAYQQSAAITAYLYHQKGIDGLREVLDAHADNNLVTDIWLRLTNQVPTQEAVQQVYGLSESELFEHAYEWLQENWAFAHLLPIQG